MKRSHRYLGQEAPKSWSGATEILIRGRRIRRQQSWKSLFGPTDVQVMRHRPTHVQRIMEPLSMDAPTHWSRDTEVLTTHVRGRGPRNKKIIRWQKLPRSGRTASVGWHLRNIVENRRTVPRFSSWFLVFFPFALLECEAPLGSEHIITKKKKPSRNLQS